MFKNTGKIFSIDPIIEQVQEINFDKRLNLNNPTGSYFSDPWTTLPEYHDTPLGHVLENLGPIGEARLLKLTSSETYTAHGDPDDRYHLALTTNPFCYLIDFNTEKLYHIPVDGKLWLMDTSKIHVAANFGGRDRVHLVIRLLLPKFDPNRKKVRIKFDGGDFDWKQESYIEIMPRLNQLIKSKYVTGFDRINDKEIDLNVVDRSVIDPIVDALIDKGFEVFIS